MTPETTTWTDTRRGLTVRITRERRRLWFDRFAWSVHLAGSPDPDHEYMTGRAWTRHRARLRADGYRVVLLALRQAGGVG